MCFFKNTVFLNTLRKVMLFEYTFKLCFCALRSELLDDSRKNKINSHFCQSQQMYF